MNDLIALTALGGYLGAGKSTLLNEILDSPHSERIALIINDFGDVNIDAQLVRSRSADTLELTNGCVCCNLVDGMAAAIDRIRTMRPLPRLVVVEVSGVGDPATVAGWGDLPGFRRGGALVCVDPGTIERHAADRWVADTVRRQLRGADVILLTKTDVRPADDVARVRTWLRGIAPDAQLVERGDVAAMLRSGFAATAHRGTMPPDDEVSDSSHLQRHTAWTVTFASPVAPGDLERALRRLPEVVERVKGIVPVDQGEGPRRAVINRAGGVFELRDDGAWDRTPGRLVLIAPVPPGRIDDPTGDLTALALRSTYAEDR